MLEFSCGLLAQPVNQINITHSISHLNRTTHISFKIFYHLNHIMIIAKPKLYQNKRQGSTGLASLISVNSLSALLCCADDLYTLGLPTLEINLCP